MRLQAERKPMTQVTGRARASRVGTLTASQHSETSPLLPDLRIPPGLRASSRGRGPAKPRTVRALAAPPLKDKSALSRLRFSVRAGAAVCFAGRGGA